VKTWDVIVIGGGIIGLSLSIALRKRGVKVLVVERGEPGREASYAAAGMLADCGDELLAVLRPLAKASARMYPEFVHELQDESGLKADLRDDGTILLQPNDQASPVAPAVQLSELEPALVNPGFIAHYFKERSVDPRALVTAALKAAKHREVDISSGTMVTEILVFENRVTGVRTDKTTYSAPVVVNCAGAWSGTIPPHSFPTRPVKGQIMAVVGAPVVRHVVRSPEVYLVPRSDGRVVIGATAEEAGYDKQTHPEAIQRLHHAALKLVPALGQARMLEAWAGLRPGTPDGLPLLGETSILGYFAATGHFRDGILLAPVTAQVMAELIIENKTNYDISAFSPLRYERTGTSRPILRA
jgi:glycine oxidase